MAFSMSWDPIALKEISQLIGFANLLSPAVQEAMSQAGDLIVESAVANTWAGFQNPTGDLADSIQKLEDSPYEVQIGSDLPYAARREWGFSGQTDSLGRFYPNDPGILYLTDAMAQNQDMILGLLSKAMESSFASIGGS